MKRMAIGFVALLIAFAAMTWWALESGGVAVIETTNRAGEQRSTHVWFAERNGVLWIEAGSPVNGWFVDVQRDPRMLVRIENSETLYRAIPVHNEAERIALRAALHAKYGFRDTWVGMFVDASFATPVRIEALQP